MIRSVSADRASFRTVHFEPGFNVILADRTKDSTKRDTRNGLGKSTLIEIIHFCLGSGAQKTNPLMVEPLKGWTFTLELELTTGIVTVSRNTANPRQVVIDGPTDRWPIPPTITKDKKTKTYSINDWTRVLGALMFGLPTEGSERKYLPTFRSLISYFVRRSSDAYSIPFEHYRKQLAWDVQVNNAYLLGLNWDYASDLQSLKDRKTHLDNLKKGLKEGVLTQYLGSIGELEAEQVRVQAQIDENAEGLATFNVLPQYRQLEQEANRQTREIQKLRDERLKRERRLSYYESSLADETDADAAAVAEIYEQAGVQLSGAVRRRLTEVEEFHTAVVANRKAFLAGEIDRLKAEISDLSTEIARVTGERGEIMSTLTAHGPWDEYQKLTEQQSTLKAEYQTLEERIKTLREIQDGTSAYKIDRELLIKNMRQDYEERRTQRDRAITLFNENSKALYDAPGRLVVNIADTGYKFDVDIQRSGSRGIDSMKVFCYDLVLAELWDAKNPNPGFLIHDSVIFDGVDERQRALGLQLAARKAESLGFQYICTLNSDMVPRGEFDASFEFDRFVRLTLTDATLDGGLLGIRY
ncbi:hypothetical protein ATO2_14260 [Roseovarius sp. 22II1-1F6A]|nr:hypothetical protein ATO2_14260 [Roseovarius sp. 22II1-1F6A]